MQAGFVVRDYLLEAKVGEGGMGEVWRSRHRLLDKPVAIKVMSEHLLADPAFEARFIQEAQAQARLHHPQIIGATDFFREQGRYYLVMPMIEGYSLEDRLKRGLPPLEDALRISTDVLAALDYAHQQAVIHRDVKPSNILIEIIAGAPLTLYLARYTKNPLWSFSAEFWSGSRQRRSGFCFPWAATTACHPKLCNLWSSCSSPESPQGACKRSALFALKTWRSESLESRTA